VKRSRTPARVAALTGLFVCAAACAKVAGIDDLEIGQCKGGLCTGDAGPTDDVTPEDGDVLEPTGDGGLADALAEPCPAAKGSPMVRVGSPANNFCIDATEATVADYRAFTTEKGTDVSGQPPQCAWNTSYAAAFGGADDIPIAGIDWCDAYAFCKWAGKRLCGKQTNNTFAGPVRAADLNDFNSHEWLLACSAQGQLRYPYGSIQKPSACNTGENDAGKSLPVRSKPECVGGYPGLYDLVGNLWEWYDGPCVAGDAGADAGDAGGPAKEECYVKGGAFANVGTNLDCRAEGRGATRDRRGQDIGVRCCAD